MLRLNKFLLLLSFASGIFLRFYQLDTQVPFFADQGWFFLSARDALLSGKFPLLGITSSVTWLHQGPLFTHLLIPGLFFFKGHPISAFILTSGLGVISIALFYFLLRLWFGTRTAAIGSLLIAGSPQLVILSRTAYHTSFIPAFLLLLLIFLTRRKYLLAFVFLGFLYQLELATVIFWPIFGLFLYSSNYRPRLSHLAGFLLGIWPFLLAGPLQSGGVFIWFVYHLLFHSPSVSAAWPFYSDLITKAIFPFLPNLGFILLAIGSIKMSLEKFHFSLWFFLPLVAILVNRTLSEAYFSLLIIPLLIIVALAISRLPQLIGIPLALVILFSNAYFLISRDFLLGPGAYYGPSLQSKIRLTRSLLAESSTIEPVFVMQGEGSQFASYDDPYIYLSWWLGLTHTPSGTHSTFLVDEPHQTFRVIK